MTVSGRRSSSREPRAAYLAQEVLAGSIEEADLEQLMEVSPPPSSMAEIAGLAARTESEQELEAYRARLRKSLAGRGGEAAVAALDILCAAERPRSQTAGEQAANGSASASARRR